MTAMEAGLAILAEEGSQEELVDSMQSREELYELLDYDPAHPERWLEANGLGGATGADGASPR